MIANVKLVPKNETIAVQCALEENGPIEYIITYVIGIVRRYKLYALKNNKLVFLKKESEDPKELEDLIEKFKKQA